MPMNITDTAAFTSPVTSPINADAFSAAEVQNLAQQVANRARYLYNLQRSLLAGASMLQTDVLPSIFRVSGFTDPLVSGGPRLVDGMFFAKAKVSPSISELRTKRYGRDTGDQSIVADASVTFHDAAAASYPGNTGSDGVMVALITIPAGLRAYAHTGGTWAQVTSPPLAVASIAANKITGRVVAVGSGGAIYSDDNGTTWSVGTAGVEGRVDYYPDAGLFVAYGNELWTSPDGATWTDRTATLPSGTTSIHRIVHLPGIAWVMSAQGPSSVQRFLRSTAGPAVGSWVVPTVGPPSVGTGSWPMAGGAGAVIASKLEEVWSSLDGGDNWSLAGRASISPTEMDFDDYSKRIVARNPLAIECVSSLPLPTVT